MLNLVTQVTDHFSLALDHIIVGLDLTIQLGNLLSQLLDLLIVIKIVVHCVVVLLVKSIVLTLEGFYLGDGNL